jgi:tRNA A37 threonylcarbamoyltransferase TsaD
MIAYAGYHRLMAGESEPNVLRAQPRWPLDTLMKTPAQQ